MSEVSLKGKACRDGMMIFPPHDAYVGRSLDLYGEFSVGEQEFFKFASRGGAAIDVGANLGAHSLFMAKHFSHVYSFEPQELIYRCLKANLATWLNTTSYQAAVGSEEGIIHLPILDYTVANNYGGLGKYVDFPSDIETVQTQLRMLDKVEAVRRWDKVDLIKIDVEGMEKEVLEGAQALIDEQRPLMYIENDKANRSAELVKFIYNLGYRAIWHIVWLYNPENFFGNKENVFKDIVSFNLICLPNESKLNVAGTPCTPDKPWVPEGFVA